MPTGSAVSPTLVLVALAYHSFYAVIPAYITAYIARDKARKAVIILGTKEAIMWVLGTLLLWHHTPPWYNITKAWYVAAQIQNLLDKDYETAYSYNSPRRGAYVTVGWQQQ